jgi:short-subunit dehydrogenase
MITGVVEGLGRALCDKLLIEGHAVVGLDHNGAGLQTLANNQHFHAITVDLADQAMVARTMDELHGQEIFDLVILNAGISATGRFEGIPAAAYEKLLRINVETPMIMASRLMAQGMVAPGGTIVFIASLSHATGYPGASVYCASKDAIAIYAKSIRSICAAKDVNVLCVFPGPLRTAHAERHAPKGANAEKRMTPKALAEQIIAAVKRRSKVLYPGFAAKFTRIAGFILPRTMSHIMRRIIFEKLDKSVF